ncbi:hypothetical protein HELRODRAFT_158582 [Helobdella robusta]|uniref:Uncharacterized protein n=1 Tax=Helobdella robusta TaxID=6412 RepID=T1EMZ2_HELRO|nr:hypothetical protein HELRODRAFT_158582 [Helobdella robusta]ESO12137.1 hypothetical protein HELRODRAFT_158582 [Helobdella robusta]
MLVFSYFLDIFLQSLTETIFDATLFSDVDDSMEDSELELDSYTMFRKDRDNYGGRGQEPTRKNNVLDLVISTEEDMIEDIQVGEKFGSSDHKIKRFEARYN